MAGKFLGYKEAAAAALARSHTRTGYSFYFVYCPVPTGYNPANIGQSYIFATANEGIVMFNHCF
jgi:hypothetical protein